MAAVIEVYRGSTIIIPVVARWAVTKEPVDLTGAKLMSTCRRIETGEAAAFVKKTANLSGGGNEQIVIDADPLTGRATVYATKVESLALLDNVTYDMDLIALFTDGTEAPLAVWKLRVLPRPTTTNVA